jgi:hypothetical protein
MARPQHNYGEGISFYYIPKKDFDTLLDQVLIISQEDYDIEAKDDFYGLVDYWNNKGQAAIDCKIARNKDLIKHL